MCLLALLRRLRLGLLPASIISTFLIIQYGVMTGLQTSTFRALVMFLLGVAALCLGRTYDLLSAMSLAAILLLLENPFYLYHTGFLLSFGAIMGIGLVNPCILYLIPYNYRRKKLVQSVCVSLAVQLATLPIVLNSYYQVSVCGILLNLVVVPLMTIVLVLGIVGGVVGLWFELLGFLLLCPCRWILMLYEWLSKMATKVPGSVWITGKPAMWRAVIYYILLLVFLIWISFVRTKYKYRECSYRGKLQGCGIAVMLTITILLTSRWDERFAVTMLSVGQGECTVIHGRDTPTVLIDGGSTDIKEVGKYRILPYLKANRLHQIDTVFLSHTDTDHVSGILELLQAPESGVHIQRLILPAVSVAQQNKNYHALLSAAATAGTKVYTMSAGEALCLSASPKPEDSPVLYSFIMQLSRRQTSEKQVPNEQAATGQVAVGQASEKQVPNEQVVAGQVVIGQASEKQMPNEQVVAGQVVAEPMSERGGDSSKMTTKQKTEYMCIYPKLEDYEDGEGDINEHSLVLLMSYVNFRMLFTGDISSSVEAQLLELLPDCNILNKMVMRLIQSSATKVA